MTKRKNHYLNVNEHHVVGEFLRSSIAIFGVLTICTGCSLEPKVGNARRASDLEPAASPSGSFDTKDKYGGETPTDGCDPALIDVSGCESNIPVVPLENRELRFLTLLKDNCSSCHNPTFPGVRLRDVSSPQVLIDSGFVTPTHPETSMLWNRLESLAAPMPPRPMARISDENLSFLKSYITQDMKEVGSDRVLVPFADETVQVMNDMKKIADAGRAQTRFIRYISLTALHNQKSISDAVLKQAVNAVSRTINSLSFRPAVVLPDVVSSQLLRIDLRDYGWEESDWNALVANYPYKNVFSAEQRASIKEMTDPDPENDAISGTEVASVRAEWFLANATRPENYHRLLNMPSTTQELEQRLGFSILQNLERIMTDNNAKSDVVARSGFMNSGVSSTNRVMERHSINTGSFWISYDFAPPTAGETQADKLRKNVFSAPFGPSLADPALSFKHDGGEVIFSLPNGMFGYLLVTAAGARLDVAPVAIVSDPARPEGILNGLSCMTCHRAGLIPKEDEVTSAIESRLAGDLKRALKRLYAPKNEVSALLEGDNQLYLAAVRKASIHKDVESVDIVGLGVRYEREVSLQMAAAELGTTQEILKKLINDTPDLSGQLSSLIQGTFSMKRPLFEIAVPQLIDLVNALPR